MICWKHIEFQFCARCFRKLITSPLAFVIKAQWTKRLVHANIWARERESNDKHRIGESNGGWKTIHVTRYSKKKPFLIREWEFEFFDVGNGRNRVNWKIRKMFGKRCEIYLSTLWTQFRCPPTVEASSTSTTSALFRSFELPADCTSCLRWLKLKLQN